MNQATSVHQHTQRPSSTASASVRLNVPDMGSDHCAGIVSASLKRVEGVEEVRTSIATHHVDVRFDPARVDTGRLKAAVERAGYDVAQVVEQSGAAGMREVRLTVPGMGSDHCAGIVAGSIKRLSGIAEVGTNIANHRVTIRFDPGKVDAAGIRDAVERAGYDVAAVEEAKPSAKDRAAEEDIEERYLAQAWKRVWIAAVPTILIMIVMGIDMFWVPVPGYLATVAILGFPVVFLYGGLATHRSAWRSLTNRTANMDVLISLGSAPPYLIGLVGFFYPMTSFIEMAATIMTFHMIGRYLETRAKGRASQAIKQLITFGAKTASVLRDGQEVEVLVNELQVGDVMVVRPGTKVPTDGEVVEGNSHLDESIATGESIPVEKGPGDAVIGATINKEGLLKVRATRVGADTFLSQVLRLIEEAQGSKVPIEEFADWLTAKFVPAVMLISLASFAIWLLFGEDLRPILTWGAAILPWVNPELTPLVVLQRCRHSDRRRRSPSSDDRCDRHDHQFAFSNRQFAPVKARPLERRMTEAAGCGCARHVPSCLARNPQEHGVCHEKSCRRCSPHVRVASIRGTGAIA